MRMSKKFEKYVVYCRGLRRVSAKTAMLLKSCYLFICQGQTRRWAGHGQWCVLLIKYSSPLAVPKYYFQSPPGAQYCPNFNTVDKHHTEVFNRHALTKMVRSKLLQIGIAQKRGEKRNFINMS